MLLVKTTIGVSLLYTLIGYILYVLTTKMDVQINMIVFALLLFGFIYEHHNQLKEEEMNNDPVLSEQDKENIICKHNQQKIILAIISIVIIGFGSSFYYHRKTIQHAGYFSYEKYFLE